MIEENKQQPYTAASEVCNSLGTLVPKAMYVEQARFSQKLKTALKDVDQYVADKLKYKNKQDLCNYFGKEQVDAIAIAIWNFEENQDGIIIADATGTGKGRQAAGLLRYAILSLGKVPIFFTEKKHLMNDIFRDLYDIGFDAGVPMYIKQSVKTDSTEFTDEQILEIIADDIREEELRIDYEPTQKFNREFDIKWIITPPKSFDDDELNLLEEVKEEVIELYRQHIIENGITQDKFIRNINYEEDVKKALAAGRHILTPFIPNRIDIKNLKGDIIYPAITYPEINKIYHKVQKGNKWVDGEVDVSQFKLPSVYKLICLPYSQVSRPYTDDKKTLNNKVKLISKYSMDNVILLDESHNASGMIGGELSNTGEMIFNFVKNSAMTDYLSATYAKRAVNMPLYAIKTSIRECNLSDQELITAFQEGKNALQEAVSAELTRNGQLLRRERKISGRTEYYYESAETEIGLNQISKINKVASVFEEIQKFSSTVKQTIKAINKEIPADQPKLHFAGNVNRLRFLMFNFFLLGLKVRQTIEKAVEHLNSGKKTVIAIANTMESALNNMSKDFRTNQSDKKYAVGDVIENDFKLYLAYLLNYTMRYKIEEVIVNDQGEKTVQNKTIYILDDKGVVAQQMRDMLMPQFNAILSVIEDTHTGVYIAPIDMIKAGIKASGFSIDEITGRQREIEFDGALYEKGTIVKRKTKKTEEIIRDFNENKVDCLILNQSGAAGVSMHAIPAGQAQKVYKTPPISLTNKSEVKARAMVVTQMELDINKEVQKLGRINRTGQVYDPDYTYIISAIPSEKRLTSLQEKKLRSLMANVSSNQTQAEDMFSADDFFSDVAIKPCKETLDAIRMRNLAENIKSAEDIYEVTKMFYFKEYDEQNNFYKVFSEKLTKEIDTLSHQGLYTGKMIHKNYFAEPIATYPFYLGNNEAKTSFGRHSILDKLRVTEYQEKYVETNIAGKINDYLYIRQKGALENTSFNTLQKFSEAARVHVNKMIDNINKYTDEHIAGAEGVDSKIKILTEQLESEKKSQEAFKDIHKAVELNNKIKEIDEQIRIDSQSIAELAMAGKMTEIGDVTTKITNLQADKKVIEIEFEPLRPLLERRSDIREGERKLRDIEEKIETQEKLKRELLDRQKLETTTLGYVLSYVQKIGGVYNLTKYEYEDGYNDDGALVYTPKVTFSDTAVLVGVKIPNEDHALTLGSIELHFTSPTETQTLNLYKLHREITEEQINLGLGQEYQLSEIEKFYKDNWNSIVGKIDTSYKSEKYIVSGNILRTFILCKDAGLNGQIIKYNTIDNKVRIGLEISNKSKDEKSKVKIYDILAKKYAEEKYGIYYDGNVKNFERFILDYAYYYWLERMYELIDKKEEYDSNKTYATNDLYFQITTKKDNVFIHIRPSREHLEHRSQVRNAYSNHKQESMPIGEKITKEQFLTNAQISIISDSVNPTNYFAQILAETGALVNASNYEFVVKNARYPEIPRTLGGSLSNIWWDSHVALENVFLTNIQTEGTSFQTKSRLKLSADELLSIFKRFEEKRLKPTLLTNSEYMKRVAHEYVFEVYVDEIESIQEEQFVEPLDSEESNELDALIDELTAVL